MSSGTAGSVAVQPAWPVDECGCGQKIHYTDRTVERWLMGLIARTGPLVVVADSAGRAFWVPRHFIACHGLQDEDVSIMAADLGWPPFEGQSITCPNCGRTSFNPYDIREGYCGNCHDWTTRRGH